MEITKEQLMTQFKYKMISHMNSEHENVIFCSCENDPRITLQVVSKKNKEGKYTRTDTYFNFVGGKKPYHSGRELDEFVKAFNEHFRKKDNLSNF